METGPGPQGSVGLRISSDVIYMGSHKERFAVRADERIQRPGGKHEIRGPVRIFLFCFSM